MKAAVYPFPDVLRGLRKEAGMSVLEAGFATQYKNYDRWESGQTRVGADHLQTIAAAFDVEHDLWLFVYAWLVDRFTPQPGCEPVEVTGAILGPVLSNLPDAQVDLGENRRLVLRDATHTQKAVAGLTARYGGPHAGARRPPVLVPTERATVPASIPAGTSLLQCLYGDVERDLARFVGMTLMASGLGALRGRLHRDVKRQVLLLGTEPECVGEILGAGAPPTSGPLRGFNRLAARAARLASRFQRMTNRQLEDLRRLEEAATGAPVTIADVKASLRQAARDDDFWDSQPELLAEEVVAALPDPDSALVQETRELYDQADRAARRALKECLDDAQATADPRAAFDALQALEADPPDD